MIRPLVAGVLGLAVVLAGCVQGRTGSTRSNPNMPPVELTPPLTPIHEAINQENPRADPRVLRGGHPGTGKPDRADRALAASPAGAAASVAAANGRPSVPEGEPGPAGGAAENVSATEHSTTSPPEGAEPTTSETGASVAATPGETPAPEAPQQPTDTATSPAAESTDSSKPGPAGPEEAPAASPTPGDASPKTDGPSDRDAPPATDAGSAPSPASKPAQEPVTPEPSGPVETGPGAPAASPAAAPAAAAEASPLPTADASRETAKAAPNRDPLLGPEPDVMPSFDGLLAGRGKANPRPEAPTDPSTKPAAPSEAAPAIPASLPEASKPEEPLSAAATPPAPNEPTPAATAPAEQGPPSVQLGTPTSVEAPAAADAAPAPTAAPARDPLLGSNPDVMPSFDIPERPRVARTEAGAERTQEEQAPPAAAPPAPPSAAEPTPAAPPIPTAPPTVPAGPAEPARPDEPTAPTTSAPVSPSAASEQPSSTPEPAAPAPPVRPPAPEELLNGPVELPPLSGPETPAAAPAPPTPAAAPPIPAQPEPKPEPQKQDLPAGEPAPAAVPDKEETPAPTAQSTDPTPETEPVAAAVVSVPRDQTPQTRPASVAAIAPAREPEPKTEPLDTAASATALAMATPTPAPAAAEPPTRQEPPAGAQPADVVVLPVLTPVPTAPAPAPVVRTEASPADAATRLSSTAQAVIHDTEVRTVSAEADRTAAGADPTAIKSEVAPRSAVVVGKPVARVGDQVITVHELRQAVLQRRKGMPAGPLTSDDRVLLARTVLNDLIDRSLVVQEAKRELKNPKQLQLFNDQADKIFNEEEIQPLLRQTASANIYELRQKLSERGESLEDQRDAFRQEFLFRGYLEHKLGAKMKVELPEMRRYYAAHLHEFDQPAQVTWREILVEVGKSKDRVTAKRKADAALDRLRRGADFAAVARTESDGPNKTDGGLWQTSPGGYAVPAVNAALDALPVGQVSTVIEGPTSFHIVRVEGRRPAGPASFSEVQDRIRRTLRSEKVQKESTAYLARLRARTVVTSELDDPRVTRTGATAPAGPAPR